MISVVVGIAILAVLALRAEDRRPALALGAEHAPRDEAQAIEDIKQYLSAKPPPAVASICARANFSVVENLEPRLSSSVFSAGAKYSAIVRFAATSEASFSELFDGAGFALKLVLTEKGDLPTTPQTQDLLFAQESAYPFADVDSLARALRAGEADATEREPTTKTWLEQSELLQARWWSQLPSRYGEGRAAKFGARTCTPQARPAATTNLGEALRARGACFEILVQFQTDPRRMPVENAKLSWDELIGPFEPVAIVNVAPATQQDNIVDCKTFTFDAWQSVDEHRPLGGIQRLRKALRTSGDDN